MFLRLRGEEEPINSPSLAGVRNNDEVIEMKLSLSVKFWTRNAQETCVRDRVLSIYHADSFNDKLISSTRSLIGIYRVLFSPLIRRIIITANDVTLDERISIFIRESFGYRVMQLPSSVMSRAKLCKRY